MAETGDGAAGVAVATGASGGVGAVDAISVWLDVAAGLGLGLALADGEGPGSTAMAGVDSAVEASKAAATAASPPRRLMRRIWLDEVRFMYRSGKTTRPSSV